MRLLTYTNLYPGADQPRHGIFVEERLRQLVASHRIKAKVCALRPARSIDPRKYLGSAQKASAEERNGLCVSYVTVPTLPAITNWIDPMLWAHASRKVVADLVGDSRRDTILDAHFLFPDAVSAVILGRQLGLPVVMTARGSDVNVKCENIVMRRWVRWAAKRCDAIVTVSQALATKLGSFGIPADSIHVLPNGVDLDKFQPQPDQQLRVEHAASGALLLSVGHLLEAKGHHIAIEALASLPNTALLIVGEGPEEKSLRALAKKLGVALRVHFLGYVPHTQMAAIYSTADFTVLASASEGMPNVMLESLACGTRVVATDVGGIGEVITEPVAGALMGSRSAEAVIESIRMLTGSTHSRSDTREFAEDFGWNQTIERQLSLYRRVLDAHETAR